MALATEDLICGEIHRAHEELWKLSERHIDDPAQVAEHCGRSERLLTMALVCDMTAMQRQKEEEN